MKLSNKILLFILIFLLNLNLSYASSIDNIQVLDENNLNFSVSSDVILPEGKIDTELKIMKDVNITFVSKDFEDKNKLTLNLSSDLELDNNYSLINILGPSGNMDFITGLSLDAQEIQNSEKNQDISAQGISKLVILNSRTIEIYYNNIIEENELEFKLYNELSINEISASGNLVNLNLNDKLEKSTNYILMILSLQDNNGNYVKLDEDLLELLTSKNLKSSIDSNTTENITTDENIMNAGTGTVENVALNSAETPDTGPETTVLIVLTFILNSIFFLRKKIIKK